MRAPRLLAGLALVLLLLMGSAEADNWDVLESFRVDFMTGAYPVLPVFSASVSTFGAVSLFSF